jgi:hypothetical protein
MSQKNTANQAHNNAANASAKIFDTMKKYKMPKVDMEATMDSHRKNMETLSHAHKTSIEMMHNMTKLHGTFSQEVMDDMVNHFKALTAAKSLEERSKMHSQKVNENIDKVMNHSRAMADVWSKSCSAIGENLQSRFKEHMNEVKLMADKAKNQH